MPKKTSDDLDHTDELPVLLETVVLDEGGVPHLLEAPAEDTSQHAVLAGIDQPPPGHAAASGSDAAAREGAIHELETEARLSHRSRELERNLAEKDSQIAELNRAVATLRQSVEQHADTERRQADELLQRDSRLRELSTAYDGALRDRETRDAELARLRAAHAARNATPNPNNEHAVTPPPSLDPGEIQALREHSAALEAYIDGRRDWWADAEVAQATLAKRVVALEHELAVTTQKLTETAAFSERESERASALRAELVDYARRLEVGERELRAARANPTPASVGQAPGATIAAPAPVEAAPVPRPAPPRADSAAADNDAGLTQGIEAIAQLEAEVGYKRQQVAAQLIELREREKRLTALTADAERVRHELTATQTELQQSRGDVARLERAVLDKDRALQARDSRIATLQSELEQRARASQKQHTVDISLGGLRLAEPLADAAHSPELVCLTGDAPKRFVLTKRTLTVGRSPQCDLQIMTHFVSREHARISLIDNTAVIEDLGSRNGVFVNAVKVNRQRLQQGDLITIGETQFRFIESMAH
jgi:uncharacterized coiled-coil protein SlyX